MRFTYSIHIIQVFSFVCVLTLSLLGVKKSLGHAQIGLLYGFNSKFLTRIPTPFICGVNPPPPPRSSTDLNHLKQNMMTGLEESQLHVPQQPEGLKITSTTIATRTTTTL